jgi:hypothetical protein
MGGVALAASVLITAGVALHPEALKAPAWVAYTAAIAFSLAGLASLARAYRQEFLGQALVCGLLGSMLLIAGWVAFGPGPRRCVGWLSGLGFIPPQFACRSAFGLGALLLGVMFAIAVRSWFRGRSEG